MKGNKNIAIPTIEEIERFVEEIGSDDLPTFGGKFVGGVFVQQIPDEIAPCIRTILESGRPINSYFELGVASGGMAYLANHFFRPETIVLLDTNEHHRCASRPQVLAGIKHTEVIGKSGDDHIRNGVADLGHTYDAMMIDGDHLYPAVHRDVELYAPFLRDGGFLILHDSALPAWGVLRVTEELKENPVFEFLGEWTSKTVKPCGVALFQKVT